MHIIYLVSVAYVALSFISRTTFGQPGSQRNVPSQGSAQVGVMAPHYVKFACTLCILCLRGSLRTFRIIGDEVTILLCGIPIQTVGSDEALTTVKVLAHL
jgi:hypothetical protein